MRTPQDKGMIPVTPIERAGIGLRASHYRHILENKPATPWFEILTDNYMGDGGQPLDYLWKIRASYPITFHGVGMSLGSLDALNPAYMQRLQALKQRFEPAWISEHLCWSSFQQHYSHDLLPLPYTDEAIRHMSAKIQQAQDMLGEQILIENVSSYIEYQDSNMSEWAFINAITTESGCALLLDINNIYVSAINHEYSAMEFIMGIDAATVREFHLAGYEDRGTHLLDTHGQPVHEPVWKLYENALRRFGDIPTLIEWDTDIPAFEILEGEADKANDIRNKLLAENHHAA